MKRLLFFLFFCFLASPLLSQTLIIEKDPFTGLTTFSKGLTFKESHIYFSNDRYLVSNKVGKEDQITIKLIEPKNFQTNAEGKVSFGIAVTIKDTTGKELLHFDDIFKDAEPINPQYLGSLSAKISPDPQASIGDRMLITIRFFDKLGDGEVIAKTELAIAEHSDASNFEENFSHYHSSPTYLVHGEHTRVYQSGLYLADKSIQHLYFDDYTKLAFKADLTGFNNEEEKTSVHIIQSLITKSGEIIYQNQESREVTERTTAITFPEVKDFKKDYYLWTVSVADQNGKAELGISQWLLFDSSLKGKESFTDYLKAYAQHIAKGGKPFDANQILNNVAAIYPSDKTIPYQKGYNNNAIGHYTAAIKELEYALKLDPEYYDAHFEMAYSYKKTRQYPDAIEHYTTCTKLKPKAYWPHYYLGWVHNEIKEYNIAIPILDVAINNNPEKKLGALWERALAKRKTSDLAGAITDYHTITTIDPKNTTAFYNIGYYSIDLKDYEGAVNALSTAIELKPTDPDHFYERGVAYKHLEEYEKAIEDFNQTIQLAYGKEPIRTYLHRGDCYFALSQKDKACKDYKKGTTYGVKAAKEKHIQLCGEK